MDEIFKGQKEYFKLGYTYSVSYRELMLKTLYKTIKDHEAELSEAMFKDLGKHPKESYVTEFFMIYKSIRHAIKNIGKWSKDKKVKTPLILKPGKSSIRNIPYGVSLIMSAYNYPLLLSIDPLIGAISAGNTVMLALSSNSKYTNEVLIRILNETFDSHYLYAFETNRDINTEILKYKFDKIFFTGSEKVGKIVLKEASNNLVSVTLELGGKSPAVVLRDANIKNAARDIVYSKVINAGQTCVASDYVLVDEEISDEFIIEVKKIYDKFYPSLESSPKIINEKEYQRLIDIYEKDYKYVKNHPQLIPEELKLSLILIEATLSDVENLESMKREIFGPILPIIKYKDLDEALRMINEQSVPLAFYVFGKRQAKIRYVLDNVLFGGGSVNTTVMHMVNENLPFGGLKESGMGSYHGKYSFDTFTHKQSIYQKGRFSLKNIINPPYNKYKKN